MPKTKDCYTAFEEADERRAEKAAEAAQNAKDKRERQRQKREAQRRAAKQSRPSRPPPPPPVDQPPPLQLANAFRAKHLRTLGLTPAQDTPLEIRKAYRQMALRFHPDKNPAPNAAALFRAIKGAYDALAC